jgi:hypothetical protein
MRIYDEVAPGRFSRAALLLLIAQEGPGLDGRRILLQEHWEN